VGVGPPIDGSAPLNSGLQSPGTPGSTPTSPGQVGGMQFPCRPLLPSPAKRSLWAPDSVADPWAPSPPTSLSSSLNIKPLHPSSSSSSSNRAFHPGSWSLNWEEERRGLVGGMDQRSVGDRDQTTLAGTQLEGFGRGGDDLRDVGVPSPSGCKSEEPSSSNASGYLEKKRTGWQSMGVGGKGLWESLHGNTWHPGPSLWGSSIWQPSVPSLTGSSFVGNDLAASNIKSGNMTLKECGISELNDGLSAKWANELSKVGEADSSLNASVQTISSLDRNVWAPVGIQNEVETFVEDNLEWDQPCRTVARVAEEVLRIEQVEDRSRYLVEKALDSRMEAKSNDKLCCICMKAQRECAFTPCGHRCVCTTCACFTIEGNDSKAQCPMCRAAVFGTLRIYD